MQVTITNVLHDGDRIELTGNLANLTDATTPYGLQVQFLDATGSIVTSGFFPRTDIRPHEALPFQVTAERPGIVGYRYVILY